MSDLSLQLQQAASQLPVSSYFDEALFQRELKTIFQQGPKYVGHQLSVPDIGNYHALPQEAGGRALVRSSKGVELISNICRHRQAVMLQGRGSLNDVQKGSAGGNIVCPLHRWTYAPEGQLLGAPHFAQDPCLNLNNYPLQEWNGLLFEDNGRDIAADLAGMGEYAALDFSGRPYFVFDGQFPRESVGDLPTELGVDAVPEKPARAALASVIIGHRVNSVRLGCFSYSSRMTQT